MVFSSPEFVFAFLPTVLLACLLFRRHLFFVIAFFSLIFYSYWRPDHVLILVGSVLFNYTIGKFLISTGRTLYAKKGLLVFGITANLLNIGYFKYSFFIFDNFVAISGSDLSFERVVLPIGISFFTFQAIAFLVDAYRGQVEKFNFLEFLLFMTFFPQLVAGPIIHHSEMMPQFAKHRAHRFSGENIILGLTVFSIGLFKKLVIADNCASIADPVFAGFADLSINEPVQAWIGAVAYAFEIYFDFSAYSDMAVGLALFFGIKLPLNFFSPYKATSIIEFWRRWHITLSRFLRDYLYFPLGGNRKGCARQLGNIMVVMCLGGLWHGAQWQFILWGAMHGGMLVLNHMWRRMVPMPERACSRLALRCAGLVGTFSLVTTAWVPFRADSFGTAVRMIDAMYSKSAIDGLMPYLWEQKKQVGILFDNIFIIGGGHFSTPGPGFAEIDYSLIWLAFVAAIVFIAPNIYQFMPKEKLTITHFETNRQSSYSFRFAWGPNAFWAVLCGMLFVLALGHMIGSISPFIYFAF